MDRARFLREHLLTSTQHTCFYHFTDARNLPSIKQHGLLSMRELRRRNIVIAAPGGDENSQMSDAQNGTDYYVCLCMTNSHPMAHIVRENRGLDIRYLQIHPNIILQHGAKITLQASNRAGVAKIAADDAIDLMDLEVLYKRTAWSDLIINDRLKTAEKYELLIPDRVAREWITNLNG